jgi:hypothetical protein
MRIIGPGYLGDFAAGDVVRFFINTLNSSDLPATVTGSFDVAVYKDAAGTETGFLPATVTKDAASITGLHAIEVNTGSGPSFYTDGSDFQVVIDAAVVAGSSLNGCILASFSIANRSESADLATLLTLVQSK